MNNIIYPLGNLGYGYEKIPYLDWSPEKDNNVLFNNFNFIENTPIVVTEKRDGDLFYLTSTKIKASSNIDQTNSVFDYIFDRWKAMRQDIPENITVIVEYLKNEKTIKYDNLKSYIEVIAIWDSYNCLDWGQTEYMANELGLYTVPVLLECYMNKKEMIEYLPPSNSEGYVLRTKNSFYQVNFKTHNAQYINEGFKNTIITTNEINKLSYTDKKFLNGQVNI